MIVVDTFVWVDHLRASDEALVGLLNAGMVLAHPFVVGELALGTLAQRKTVLDALSDLPRAIVATEAEVLNLSIAIDYSALVSDISISTRSLPPD